VSAAPSERCSKAVEHPTRGENGDLLADHLEHKSAEGIHRREILQPGSWIELGLSIDQAGENRIGPVQAE
jgi:hypothetical protein